jgi:hypothetical protein
MRSKLDIELLISMRLCMAAVADANLCPARWRCRPGAEANLGGRIERYGELMRVVQSAPNTLSVEVYANGESAALIGSSADLTAARLLAWCSYRPAVPPDPRACDMEGLLPLRADRRRSRIS